MGGEWKKFEGTMNVYQLDGIDGHRFVVSFYWEKKWHHKLKNVYGIKMSYVERLNLLGKLCSIEEYRQIQNANSFDISAPEPPSTIKMQNRISVIPEEEPWETATLPRNKQKVNTDDDQEPCHETSHDSFNKSSVKSAPLIRNEDIISEAGSTKDVKMSPKVSSKTIPNGKIPTAVEETETTESTAPNGDILEVEVHDLPEAEAEPDQSDKENRSSTIEEDLNGYSENLPDGTDACDNALPNESETIGKASADRKTNEITDIDVHDPGEPGCSKDFNATNTVSDNWWDNSLNYRRQSNR